MKHILPIIPILLLALAFASCHHGERQTLRSALQMAYADPDSALTMLHTIDRRALPPDFVIASPKNPHQRVLLFSDALPSAWFAYKPPCLEEA